MLYHYNIFTKMYEKTTEIQKITVMSSFCHIEIMVSVPGVKHWICF